MTAASRPATAKGLQSTSELSAYQRAWFARLRERAAAGEPIGIASAASTQELFQVLDIPYVISTWWAAVVSARRKAGDYRRRVASRGYPGEGQVSAVLGSAFVTDEDEPPWGGLPRPSFIVEAVHGDAARKIHELYARELGADCYLLERSVGTALEPDSRWWERSPRRVERAAWSPPHRSPGGGDGDGHSGVGGPRGAGVQPHQAQAGDGSEQRTAGVVRRGSRSHRPHRAAPVSVVDTMVVATIPRWHWGTVWARDAVRAFYEEISRARRAVKARCRTRRSG